MNRDLLNELRMSDEDFALMLGDMVNVVKETLQDDDMPVWVPMLGICHSVLQKDKTFAPALQVIFLDSFPYDQRHEILRALGTQLGTSGMFLQAVFLLNEIWLSMPDEQGKRRFDSLEDDPERKEGIMVTGTTIDRRYNGALIRCKRTAKGNLAVDTVDNKFVVEYNKLGASLMQGFAMGLATLVR